jgi:hypothetical protein
MLEMPEELRSAADDLFEATLWFVVGRELSRE